MDGFHREEMVFVVGTTNFVESLDPALLRPGRFEFHLHIPYPDNDARREIVKIYDRNMGLKMSEEALDYAVKRTGPGYSTAQGTPFSGDHINALCRSMARMRMRDGRTDASTPEDIERALTEYEEKLNLTPKEKKLLATHEAGHFIVALHCPHHPPPERITIHSEMSWAPAYVRFKQDDSRRLGETRNQMMDDLTVLVGGIESERLLLDDISTGAGGSDLQRASIIAHLLIETYGMGQGETGLRQYRSPRDGNRYGDPSEEHKRLIDHEVSALIRDAQQRAQRILNENRDALITLRDMVIEKGTLEIRTLKAMFPTMKTEESEGQEKGNGEVKEKSEKRSRKSSKSDPLSQA
jgi:cell division protease FtsH